MNKRLSATIILLLSLPLYAAENEPSPGQVGKQTREALQLQRSGQSASATERPMSGEVAERTHRRYVESFSHPIPESFKDEEQEFVRGSN